MKNTFGHHVSVTLAGESHGEALCVILDGVKPGIAISDDIIASKLALRRPQDEMSTARREDDRFSIISGVCRGKTTGTPLTILIPNTACRSEDYREFAAIPRPGHADYSAEVKYHGFQDERGGGHFSGRITAGLVAAGAIASELLTSLGIRIGTHIASIGGVADIPFSDYAKDIEKLSPLPFPVLSEEQGKKMRELIREAKAEGDSVGGILETVVTGMPAGVGEPFFDSVESMLSHILFSIPAIKGVEFGDGFAIAAKKGHEANDPYRIENGSIITESNHNGGILGGITNGMPILFRCAVKPTPSIAREQHSVDLLKRENSVLAIRGRHDPCIVHRAASVVNACTALALWDMLSGRYGTDLSGGIQS